MHIDSKFSPKIPYLKAISHKINTNKGATLAKDV